MIHVFLHNYMGLYIYTCFFSSNKHSTGVHHPFFDVPVDRSQKKQGHFTLTVTSGGWFPDFSTGYGPYGHWSMVDFSRFFHGICSWWFIAIWPCTYSYQLYTICVYIDIYIYVILINKYIYIMPRIIDFFNETNSPRFFFFDGHP
jgi:hypothetical protein